jgi:hypothetical protein
MKIAVVLAELSEVGEDVIDIVLVLEAKEHHFRARHICLGIFQIPSLAPASDGIGIFVGRRNDNARPYQPCGR